MDHGGIYVDTLGPFPLSSGICSMLDGGGTCQGVWG